MNVSVVVPIYNEVENLPILHEELAAVFDEVPGDHEFVFVDDGSSDGSIERMRELAADDSRVKLVLFRRNYGQSAAMQAGIQNASGDAVVLIDGDLQNDPADIPMMLQKLDEGFDLVHGWRKNRQDALLHRKLPSRIANWIISKVTGFPIHDLGCTLKAIRSDVASEIELYGDMHRFIPILGHSRGAACVEVVTNHRPRRFGVSKYGIGRTTRVILDLVTVKFTLECFDRPMRMFGRLGLLSGLVAAIAGIATIVMKYQAGIDMTGNPLLLLTVLATLLGAQFFGLGLLSEVVARVYYSSKNSAHYTVRERVNFEAESTEPIAPQIRRAA
ncbi:MAG: glycosyltransferase family 2 protein [Planctomycetota bacterium]